MATTLRWGSTVANSLFTLLLPATCRICEQPIEVVTAVPVCPDCVQAPQPYSGIECAQCGRFLTNGSGPHETPHCGVCRRSREREVFSFEQARSFAGHEGTLRALLQRFKYDGFRPLAKPLGRFLLQASERLSEQSFDLAVPVPLHRKRERRRGFNQAELLAVEVAMLRKIPLGVKDCVRVQDTPPQTGLHAAERRKNVAGAFDVPQPEQVRGRRVLLMDDVLTTGATASACAQALRQAGAKGIWVATVARANPAQVDV